MTKYYALLTTKKKERTGTPEGFVVDIKKDNLWGKAVPSENQTIVEFEGTDKDVINIFNGDATLQPKEGSNEYNEYEVINAKDIYRTKICKEIEDIKNGSLPSRCSDPGQAVVSEYFYSFMDEFTERTKHIPLSKKIQIFPHALLEPYDCKYYVGLDGIAFEWIDVSRKGRIYYDTDPVDLLDHKIFNRIPQFVHCPANIGGAICNAQYFLFMRSANNEKPSFGPSPMFDRPHWYITEPKYLEYIHNLVFEVRSFEGKKRYRYIKFMQILGDSSKENLTPELARERAKGFASLLIMDYARGGIKNLLTTSSSSSPELTLNDLKSIINDLEKTILKEDLEEDELQKYFESNPWLLLRGLGYIDLAAHPTLKFFDSDTTPLYPDFLLERYDSYCDILDLKLPSATLVVGLSGRHPKLSEAVHKARTQLGDYERYFGESRHRKYLFEEYNRKIRNPSMLVLIGRRPKEEIERYLELSSEVLPLQIKTYDDLLSALHEVVEFVEKVIAD